MLQHGLFMAAVLVLLLPGVPGIVLFFHQDSVQKLLFGDPTFNQGDDGESTYDT